MAQALAEQANVVVSKFVDSLQEPRTPYISPTRFSAVLGVKVMALAELTGVQADSRVSDVDLDDMEADDDEWPLAERAAAAKVLVHTPAAAKDVMLV